jgi:hypothetical protein
MKAKIKKQTIAALQKQSRLPNQKFKKYKEVSD